MCNSTNDIEFFHCHVVKEALTMPRPDCNFYDRWMRGIRSVQRNSEKIDREFEIRSDLASWDREFPFMHHELIVRYAAGFLASSLAVTLYTSLFRDPSRKRR